VGALADSLMLDTSDSAFPFYLSESNFSIADLGESYTFSSSLSLFIELG